MRELRFVQRAFEGSVLVLEADNGEQFVFPAEQIPDDLGTEPSDHTEAPQAAPSVSTPTGWPASKPAPTGASLGPREIQVRVRAGESAETLAEESGMPLDRVMRFALPVLEERARITDEARRARARRSPGEVAKLPFGETVDRRFAAHGIDPASVLWDSRRREDRQWVVIASWQRGGEQHEAEWTYARPGRFVGPVDDAASELLSDRPIPLPAPTAPPRLTLAGEPGRPVVAFPPMPDASTAPIPVLPDSPELFDQESAEAERPARRDPWQDVESPPLPLAVSGEQPRPDDAAARRPKRTRSARPAAEQSSGERPSAEHPGTPHPSVAVPRAARGGAARSPVPSWDDILLGVRRERD